MRSADDHKSCMLHKTDESEMSGLRFDGSVSVKTIVMKYAISVTKVIFLPPFGNVLVHKNIPKTSFFPLGNF